MEFEKLRQIVAGVLNMEAGEISMDTRFADDLGADSLDVVELIMSLEDEFGIAISDNDAAQLYTVGRIVDYLEKLQ